MPTIYSLVFHLFIKFFHFIIKITVKLKLEEWLEFDSKIGTIRKEEEEKRHSPYKMYGIPGYAGCQLTW